MTSQELANLMLHFATSSWGGTRKPPVVFTEHGTTGCEIATDRVHRGSGQGFVISHANDSSYHLLYRDLGDFPRGIPLALCNPGCIGAS